jgi:hypothetical protein
MARVHRYLQQHQCRESINQFIRSQSQTNTITNTFELSFCWTLAWLQSSQRSPSVQPTNHKATDARIMEGGTLGSVSTHGQVSRPCISFHNESCHHVRCIPQGSGPSVSDAAQTHCDDSRCSSGTFAHFTGEIVNLKIFFFLTNVPASSSLP